MKPSWKHAKKLLCVRLDSLGDVLMCTPAMRALRESVPGRTITLLTSPGAATLQPYLPEIDEVIRYQAPWMNAGNAHDRQVDLAFASALAERGFDGAVIFTSYSQSPLPAALLCYLANIPLRVAHCHENPYRLLTHWLADPEPDRVIRHEVRRQLDLAAHIGCQPRSTRMSFSVRTADCDAIRNRLSSLGVGEEQTWLAMHPGAGAPSRR